MTTPYEALPVSNQFVLRPNQEKRDDQERSRVCCTERIVDWELPG